MLCVCSCLTKIVPFPLSWKVWLLISRFWAWRQRSKEDRKHWTLPGVWVGVVGGVAGGLIGNKMDRQARSISESLPGAKVERVGEGIKLTLGENSVNFDFNKATLTSKAKGNLDKLVPVFKEYPDTNPSSQD